MNSSRRLTNACKKKKKKKTQTSNANAQSKPTLSIKLVKIAQEDDLMTWLTSGATRERPCEEHMPKAKESVYLVSNLVTWPTCEMTNEMH